MRILRPRFLRWGLLVAGFVVALDQASKFWLFEIVLKERTELPITSFFSLVKRVNFGVSFSFFSTRHPMGPWILSGLAALLAFGLILWLSRAVRFQTAIGLGLVIGGALGNVIDRLRVGAVLDFLLFYWRDWAWPAFNVADSAITIGVGLLLLDGMTKKGRK